VTYLTILGHGLAMAGLVFSIATLVAVPGRVFWGWFSSAHATPRAVLAWLSLGMAASTALIGVAGGLASLVLLGLAAVLLSATVLSWHGVLLAEAARLAPEGMRGAATGGVLSFGQLGALTMPLLYAGVLSFSGSHALGFILCGLPCLVVGLALLRRPPGEPQST
jgi:MFS family permease